MDFAQEQTEKGMRLDEDDYDDGDEPWGYLKPHTSQPLYRVVL